MAPTHAVPAIRTTTEPGEVAALALAAVAQDPVGNTVLGSVAGYAHDADARPWAAARDGDGRLLAVRSHADTPVGLPAGLDAQAAGGAGLIGPLGGCLAALDPPAAALGGEPGLVHALVAAGGLTVAGTTDERLYRLDTLVEPAPVPGSARQAGAEDLDVVGPWWAAFEREAFGTDADPARARAAAAAVAATGGLWLWCEPGGAAVALAARRRPVRGVARIGPVYTPPDRRGRGYGSAVTAAATRAVLAESAVPVLYTDLANPTSNAVYARLGYVRVLDRLTVRLSSS